VVLGSWALEIHGRGTDGEGGSGLRWPSGPSLGYDLQV